MLERQDHRNCAERSAIAALLQHLRGASHVDGSAIALELNIARQRNRADVALIGDDMHIYEVKTKNDTLVRLEDQLLAYSKVGNYVSVAVATRHLKRAKLACPPHVGIVEITSTEAGDAIHIHRNPTPSPALAVEALLDLLPATDIRNRILPGTKTKRRNDLVSEALTVGHERISAVTYEFLRDRYRKSTTAFWKATRNRAIMAADLSSLRVWALQSQGREISLTQDGYSNHDDIDEKVFKFVGQSFGPVPPDVVALLTA